MLARTHDLAAFTALSTLVVVVAPSSVTLTTVLLALLASQIGGVAPDIDQPTAPLWRGLPVLRFLGKLFSKMSGGHRFISHSIVGVILFSVVGYYVLVFLQSFLHSLQIDIVWWAFIAGLVSHLVMDMFTKEGVPLFLPFTLKVGIPPIEQLRITTGKKMELFVVFPALISINIWLYATHYSEVTTFLHQIVR